MRYLQLIATAVLVIVGYSAAIPASGAAAKEALDGGASGSSGFSSSQGNSGERQDASDSHVQQR